ncbi:MAG: sigma 54-interacting transcriptional regulator [Deltaproteobacteria bacterium]|jgi:PAS domain S-box-containing protein|nr:sigma 54-interacting transcriptional regulator [Deltaproteobacteria bacterium]
MASNNEPITFEDVMNILPVGILLIDQSGLVLGSNHQMATLLGSTSRELADRQVGELLPKSADEILRVVRSRRQAAGLFLSELDGCFVLARPLPRDSNIWAISVFDQRLWQNYLGYGPAMDPLTPYYKQIFESSSDGISIADNKGRLILVNEASARHVGVSREELQWRHVHSMVERGLTDDYITLDVLREKKPVTRIIKYHKSGKYIFLTGTPIFNAEGQVYLVVINERDFTTILELQTSLKQQKEILDRFKAELAEMNLAELASNEVVALSPAMRRTMETALKLAQHDVSQILLTGESGTGKGLLAKFIHTNSRKGKEPFIHINCAALPESLLEAELFGYEKGAFTGANAAGRAGLFEVAGGGTAFLDEIAEMGLPLQSKLLTFLDNKEFRRLAGHKTITASCNIIAATNQNLERLVAEGRFRQDLYYRLKVFSLDIPPLRERPEDLLELARRELAKLCQQYGQKRELDPLAVEVLRNHGFPGNVRELLNGISQAVLLSDSPQIGPFLAKTMASCQTCGGAGPVQDGLPPVGGEPALSGYQSGSIGYVAPAGQAEEEGRPGGGPLRSSLAETEVANLTEALKRCATTREMAGFLGISQAGVSRKLRKYGLKPPRSSKARGAT